MARLRMVGWEVRPVAMLDDGDTLTPLQIAPQTIVMADWEAFKTVGDEVAVQHLREQVERAGDEQDQWS